MKQHRKPSVSPAVVRSAALKSAVRESEQLYRDLIQNAHDLIQSLGADGHYLLVNRAWRETLGYSDAELARLTVFQIIHPDSHSHCQEVFSRVLAGESLRGVKTSLVAKDGRQVWLEGNITPRYVGGRLVAAP